MCAPLYQLTGTDLTQIHGIGPFLALRFIGECGTDLSQWRTAKHFTSWLTLSPVKATTNSNRDLPVADNLLN